jgi:lipopolysaccharide biosynthesis regulator YciM
VEGSENPMQGITLLREIEKIDSNNVRLQLSFGFFSAKSQQWDKAIKRFKKALELDPSNIEIHLHLANAHEQNGSLGECINELEKFVNATTDPMAKTTIQEYVQKLKKTNN